MNIFERIGRWLTPYKYAFDEEKPEPINYKERKALKEKEKLKPKEKGERKVLVFKPKGVPVPTAPKPEIKQPTVVTKKPKQEDLDHISTGALGVEIVELQESMDTDDALFRMKFSDSHIAYYFHDTSHHQIAIRFEQGSRWRFYERDDVKRKQLKPLLYPKSNKPFDRTHVIPIGYHGSENDNRLLVGFNSEINRIDLNNFETLVGIMNDSQDILWFVDIERQDDGSAIWKAYVWDEHGEILTQDTFHDTDEFVWL